MYLNEVIYVVQMYWSVVVELKWFSVIVLLCPAMKVTFIERSHSSLCLFVVVIVGKGYLQQLVAIPSELCHQAVRVICWPVLHHLERAGKPAGKPASQLG